MKTEENNPRLFVQGMNLDTTDDDLEAYFSAFGTLTEARITRHDSDGASKGFGFVTFSDIAELDACQRARPHFIDSANVSTFRYVPKEEDQKNMSHLDVPRGHCKKLYVSELDKSVQEDDLNCYFGQYGNIIHIDLKAGSPDNVKFKGNFAFIEFDDHDPVDKCIIEGHHQLDGKSVVVRRALWKPGKDLERKIIVGPLTDQLTDAMMYSYCSKYGKVTRIVRPLDKYSRKRRDFGFIEFNSMDPVERIVQNEKHDIEGHVVRVKKVGPKDWSQSKPGNMNSGNHYPVWNQPSISTMRMGMYDQNAFAMNGMNPGIGAMYQGIPALNQAYQMPFAREFAPMMHMRSMRPMRSQERYNPYNSSKEPEMPEEALMTYFSNFGNVIKVHRPWDSKFLRKRDYAFVEFDNPNSVRMCMLCPTHQIMGQSLIVRKGVSPGEPNMDRKVFVDLKGKSKVARE